MEEESILQATCQLTMTLTAITQQEIHTLYISF